MPQQPTSTRSPANKGQKYPPEPLTPAELGRLLDACSRRAPSGIRNRALIATMALAGLRVSEALSLKPSALDLETGSVRVLKGKGRKARVAAFMEKGQAVAILERWLDKRKALGFTGRQPLFCTITASKDGMLKPGSPLSTAYVRTMIRRIGRKAGIEKRVHPHGLRHTYACILSSRVPVAYLQQSLGHSSLGTTSKYLAGLNPQEAIDAISGVALDLGSST